ncbi:MAG: hypothetical protein HYW25_04840 [Candidatus Aenigmarchaeota archaeon]|nr:hypothetical protein [Candidatus Aenigmarchaeota archaeon]
MRMNSRLDAVEKKIEGLKISSVKEGARNNFIKAAGSWKDVDTEKLKRDIYESRKKAFNNVVHNDAYETWKKVV